ncbi:MAG TPA: LysE family transporter, partial [Candidatus Limnocylindria bacterium]|nr:LysE family transporter [Candidatus Limnocylindria bacterium]
GAAEPALRGAAGVALIAIGVIGMLGLRRRAGDAATSTTTAELLRTYLRFVALTLVNPATLAYFIAVALGLGREILADAPAFVAGVVLATGTWQSGLALVSGSLHGRLRPSARGAIAILANVVVIALGLGILTQVAAG